MRRLKSASKKVLVVYPGKKASGGVAELYNVANLQSDHIRYFELYGALRNKFNFLDTLLMYPRFLIGLKNCDIVHLNPSLGKKSFVRDASLSLLSRLFFKKVIVYWHGWRDDFEEKIRNRIIYSLLFKISFKKADASVVLGTLFKKKLISLGYQNRIYIAKNCVYNKYLLEENKQLQEKSLHTPIRLLFLSRIEKSKGIYIAIETVRLLNETFLDKYELLVAGNGSELANVAKYIELNNISNIKLLGFVLGIEKHELLLAADVLIFPSYSEGLPLTVLESMSYGLPIITRSIGGIPDIVKNNENGFLTDSKDPKIFVSMVSQLCNDQVLYKKMSNKNSKTALEFSPEKFKERMTSIYEFL